jgi:RecA-family ATPase
VVAGADGSGKSWVAHAMAASVAVGQSVCGIVDVPPGGGRVVLIVGEDRDTDHLYRMHHTRRWMTGHCIAPPAPDMLRVIALRGQRMPLMAQVGDEIRTTQHWDWYIHQVAGTRLVVLDPLVMFHDLDEANTRAMESLARKLIACGMDMGHAVIIVHHASQHAVLNGRDDHHVARGSTALITPSRATWTLRAATKDEGAGMDDERRKDWRALVNPKASHAREGATRWLWREPTGLMVAQEVGTPADMAHEREQEREAQRETARDVRRAGGIYGRWA